MKIRERIQLRTLCQNIGHVAGSVKNGMNEERFCVALVDDEVGFGGKEV